ncbi:MAG: inositol monophosphatase [Elusimicrobia bacterium]|nr:inositol monophosphatase [Elusimicrobiota bacterium]
METQVRGKFEARGGSNAPSHCNRSSNKEIAQRWVSPKGRAAFGLRLCATRLTYHCGYAAPRGALARTKIVSGKLVINSVTEPNDHPPLKSMRQVLRKCLDEAGSLLQKNLGKAPYHYKGQANLVTLVDEKAQEMVIKNIRRKFPDHNYIAEEGAVKKGESEYTWVIDPLDGTTNYAHGFPMSCVSIGITRKNQAILGGIYDPFRKELFWAEKGKGAYVNGVKCHVSSVKQIKEALLVTGFPYDRIEKSEFYVQFYRAFMEKCHDVRRSGSAALDLAWVACGRADGFWEFKLNPWDVAAGKLIVEEAGGKVTDFKGREWERMEAFGTQTLATNKKIHAEMLRQFHGVPLY